MGPTILYVEVRNRSGSVEHYYHFLLGYLLPLCAYLAKRPEDSEILLARGCGPLSRHVAELRIPGLLLCERRSFADFADEARARGVQRIEIQGVDGRHRDAESVKEVTAQGMLYIRQRLQNQIDSYSRQLEFEWGPSPRVLVIERENPDPFYFSAIVENPGGGATRRKITNQREMVAALNTKFGRTKAESLIDFGLAEQIALFQTADVVVAQHGAALTNVVWMRGNAHVFEFIDDPDIQTHFSKLSSISGIDHHTLLLDGAKSPVNVDALIESMTTTLA